MRRNEIKKDIIEIIELLWQRSDVDMWDYKTYKGITYVIDMLSLRNDYSELYKQLHFYVNHSDELWKTYFLQLCCIALRNDVNIPSYQREKIPSGKIQNFDCVVNLIGQYKNAFNRISGLATDIYDEVIVNKKEIRKNVIFAYGKTLHIHNSDIESLYTKALKYEHDLNYFYNCIVNNESNYKSSNSVNIIKKHSGLNLWETFALHLEYKSKPDLIDKKCKELNRKKEKELRQKNKNSLILAHELGSSKIFDEFIVYRVIDIDSACERGCMRDEYDESEWVEEVEYDLDVETFLENCDLQRSSKYKFVGVINENKFNINIDQIK
jgi:hypothetical protein